MFVDALKRQLIHCPHMMTLGVTRNETFLGDFNFIFHKSRTGL